MTAANCADVFTKALGPQVFPTHAIRLASDTTAALAPSLAMPPARVMMIRGVERSAPALWRRPQRLVGARFVASVGVQCDLLADVLPDVASVGVQCSSSAGYLSLAADAVNAAVEYQAEIHQTAIVCEAQNRRVTEAGYALHARLTEILDDCSKPSARGV